jgi:hypothetical protein
MYHLPLEAFTYLEVWSLGHDGPVLLSIDAQALLCNFFVCMFLLFSSSGEADDDCQWKFQAYMCWIPY